MDDELPADGVSFPLIVTFRSDPNLFSAEPSAPCAIAFCQHLALTHVRNLHVAGIIPPTYDEDQTKEWVQLFSGLSSLTTLGTAGLAAYRLPDMLKAKMLDDSDRLCLGTLQRAEVEAVSFGVTETFRRGEPGDFTEQLVQSLVIRAQETSTLATLVIKRSKCVDLPDVKMLEKFVGSVEWDGVVDADSGQEDFELNYY
ncbi:uncharacterized protein B0H18DRAFT_1123892 [Fomitopsis serialis]|uniref:uncharacterized protein n=1 Tax=Fomitopsis serialis TaxID=139415 RepID=UPI002008C9FD|nr:uncharacterized protein B0H18DRAFT_1123892 [Neoantrodia serialis]KAH9916906.1 hypothetical protein B0H18DRAFT_1123892 [Neoantrodia serialis]